VDRTLLKGLHVLEALVRLGPETRLTDIAAACDLDKSNAHRVLLTLRHAGYAQLSPATRRYSATLKLSDLGMRVREQFTFGEAAHAVLETLAEATGETAQLVVLDRHAAVVVDACVSSEWVSFVPQAHSSLPVHRHAFGLVLLAFLAPQMREAELDLLGGEAGSPDLLAQLARIGRDGYLAEASDPGDTYFSIAAPVRSAGGSVIAAIGISGPRWRWNDDLTETRIAAVLRGAADVARSVGEVPAAPFVIG